MRYQQYFPHATFSISHTIVCRSNDIIISMKSKRQHIQ